MRRLGSLVWWLSLVVSLVACSHPARAPGSCDGPCPGSKIDHVIVIVQENHTFDNHFGRYCTAPFGAPPSCNAGPACCEAGPELDPGSSRAPAVLTDEENRGYDPNHQQDCEVDEIDGGKMDRFISSALCGDARNFAYSDPNIVKPYWDLAGAGALADRYFQPTVGASSANDMYFARARFVFKDNQFGPDSIGKECSFISKQMEYSDPMLGDLLTGRGVSWAWYIEGYQAMLDARKKGVCPDAPADCAFGLTLTPCVYEPSDVPFQYFAKFRDDPAFFRDYSQLAKDLAAGKLPQVVFVKSIGYHDEHPGLKVALSDGVAFVGATVKALAASDYAPDTLTLLTYDEGGGFFDHVPPPPTSAVDGQPYGTRVPLLAVGPFARKNFVSHVTLEHSSIVKWIEWNWQTPSLGGRDAEVANLGSLLDPSATGASVPE